MNVLQQGLGDSKYRPCPLLRSTSRQATWGRRQAAVSTPTRRHKEGPMAYENLLIDVTDRIATVTFNRPNP